MKKITFLLIALLAITFVSCSDSDDDDTILLKEFANSTFISEDGGEIVFGNALDNNYVEILSLTNVKNVDPLLGEEYGIYLTLTPYNAFPYIQYYSKRDNKLFYHQMEAINKNIIHNPYYDLDLGTGQWTAQIFTRLK